MLSAFLLTIVTIQGPILDVVPLPLQDGANGRYPMMSSDPAGGVHLCWFAKGEGKTEMLLQQSTWQGKQWGPTNSLAQGNNWLVNWADFAKYQQDADGNAIASWQTFQPNRKGYGVQKKMRATSEGKWSDASSLHKDAEAVEHGFVSFAALGEGKFFATWLQSTAAGPPTQLRYTVAEQSGSESSEYVLDDLVCDCCSTDAVVLPNGEVVVAYRNRTMEELRDLRIVRGDPLKPESWSTPLAVDQEEWKTAGCPVNGPSMANDGEFIALVYYTEGKLGHPQVKYLTSQDGGLTFSKPIVLASGKSCLGRAAVAVLPGGPAVVSWLQKQVGAVDSAAWVACAIPRGEKPGVISPIASVQGGRGDGFIQLAATSTRILAAWTADGGKSVQTASMTLSEHEE
jgi:hypothetical protein